MPDGNLHLTLAFLGEVGDAQASELIDWVSGQTVEPGEWRLDRWGCFRRPGIVWVGGAPDPILSRLQQGVWGTLEALGLGARPARFVPHVTLLRRAVTFERQGLPDVALAWSYNKIALIQSITDDRGARYQALAESQS